MFEYTPGTCASSTSRGSGSSQREGLHLFASGPQRAGSRLLARMLATIRVPFGMRMASESVPSLMRMGSVTGRTVSWIVLYNGVVSGSRVPEAGRKGGSLSEERCDARRAVFCNQ